MAIYGIVNGVQEEIYSVASLAGVERDLSKISTIVDGVERVLHEPIQISTDIEKVVFEESIAYHWWYSKTSNKWLGAGYSAKPYGVSMAQLDNGYTLSVGMDNYASSSNLTGNGLLINFVPYVISSDGSKVEMTEELMGLIKWNADLTVISYGDIRGGYDTTNWSWIQIKSQTGDVSFYQTGDGQASETFSRTGINKVAYNASYDYSIQVFIRTLSSNTLSAKLQFSNFKIGTKQLPVEFKWSNMREYT